MGLIRPRQGRVGSEQRTARRFRCFGRATRDLGGRTDVIALDLASEQSSQRLIGNVEPRGWLRKVVLRRQDLMMPGFGRSVALGGGWLAVGDVAPFSLGAVHLYQVTGNSYYLFQARQMQAGKDIMEQEMVSFSKSGYEIEVPQYMKEIVAEITHLARRNPDVSQRSGVSVRVSINCAFM